MLKKCTYYLIKSVFILLIILIGQPVLAQVYYTGVTVNTTYPTNAQVTTFAGSGVSGETDGNGTAASFDFPVGVVVDASGNIFTTEDGIQNGVVRKITSAGVVSTLVATSGNLYHPRGIAIDASGNLYIAVESANQIFKVTPSGTASVYAGTGSAGHGNGTRLSATFYNPCGVAVDASGNVYVADSFNNEIRKIDASGNVTLFAGNSSIASGANDGTGSAAAFNQPFGIVVDGSGNLFITDRNNGKIRKITSAGVVTSVAGSGIPGFLDGTGTSSAFSGPAGLAIDNSGILYVADEGNNRIRKVTQAGVVTTIAGTGAEGETNGSGNIATFNQPFGLGINKGTGNLYVGDANNNSIRMVVTAVTTYSINPALPAGLSLDPNTGSISGTPTVASPATNYTLTATNSYGTTTSALNIQVIALPLPVFGNLNYVATYIPRVSGITTTAGVYTASSDKTQMETSVQYVDGLGRPSQTVQMKGSPQGKDFVQSVVYDINERQPQQYLPYAAQGTADGSYKATAITDQGNFYSTPPTNSGVSPISTPYALTNYELSPLNRILEKGAPGSTWQPVTGSTSGHTSKMDFTINDNTYSLPAANSYRAIQYSATTNSNQSNTLAIGNFSGSYYVTGDLTVSISKDENWVSGKNNTNETYTDKEKHIVLKRMFNTSGTTLQALSTYFVYDSYGNLVFVLPPQSNADNAQPTKTILDNLCYQYRYDERNRLTQKKLPGKGWEFTVYNQLNQPVLTQDSVQRLGNKWAVTKYDALGRIIMTGIWNAGSVISLATLQASVYAGSQYDLRDYTNNSTGYNITSYPAFTSILTINYYDNYINIPGIPPVFVVAPPSTNVNPQGLLTAIKIAVLNTTSDFLWSTNYYDDRGRITKAYQQHYLGGIISPNNYDYVVSTYNFNDQLTTLTRLHKKNVSGTATLVVTVANRYLYDHMGRKIKTWEQITRGTNTPDTRTLISQIGYNEIGQVWTKGLHSTDSTNFMQTVTYSYNERGWLLKSSAPLFEESLQYNTATVQNGMTPIVQYNGNIASQSWGTAVIPDSKTYVYQYDNLNRLLSGSSSSHFDEKNITYDLMGNILTLKRYTGSTTATDDLTYTYTSGSNYTNQVQSINDATTSDVGQTHGLFTYAYDGNGNMITDNSQGITGTSGITYNMLNLPQVIAAKNTTYTYDAIGQKLRCVVTGTATSTAEYINGIQYDANGISFIQTEEGRALGNNSSPYNYEYSLTDHLGNSRFGFDTYGHTTADSVQRDEYYPFGLDINYRSTNPKNEYLYNKKELQQTTPFYDYGTRFYNPVIARWISTDNLSEKYYPLSPYNYVTNNPIKIIDADGNDWFRDTNGNIIWNNSTDKNFTMNNIIYTNIGRSLRIITDSYINTPNDLPLPEALSGPASGDKLITSLTLTGNYKDGQFTGFTYDFARTKVGATFNLPFLSGVNTPGQKDTPDGTGKWTSGLTFFAHVTTPPIETEGLDLIGRNVDVNQEINVSLAENGKLDINLTHGTYPSVKMDVGGVDWYNYQQQSFIESHATSFWEVTIPLWATNPSFMFRMFEREQKAIHDNQVMNEDYKKDNKIGSVTLNDKP